MIALERVSKSFPFGASRTPVIADLTATFPGGCAIALLGRNGAGKSTLLKLIAGTLRPSTGSIRREGTVSYPVGFGGSFHPDLTGQQNARFVARIYGVEAAALLDFVADFTELGAALGRPFGTYSAGMKARLSFGVSMGLPFDTYLVDEVTSVGDGAFRRKSVQVLEARLRAAGAIVVTHSPPMARRLCSMAAVLEGSRLRLYEDIEQGLAAHAAHLAQS